MDLGEGAPWKEAPGVLSSTPPLKPQSFPHFPQCCFLPSPLHLGERKLHNPLGAANVAKDYSQRRGKLQPEASSSPQAGWLQPPQPQVPVLDRAFLSHQLSLGHPERDTEGQWPTQTSQRIPKFSCTFPASLGLYIAPLEMRPKSHQALGGWEPKHSAWWESHSYTQVISMAPRPL